MKRIFFYWMTCLAAVGVTSCEQEYTPDGKTYEKQIVIESYIEKSNSAYPVYALITYSLPFYSSFGIDVVNNSYVHDADVSIEYNSRRVQLQEICLNDLQEPFKSELLKSLGYKQDSVKTDICVYVDINREVIAEEGIDYRLRVIKDKDTLTGYTTIPQLIPIDSIWFEIPPGTPKDSSYAQMFCIISDIPGHKDFYRYFTAGQNERLIANTNSVTDDVFYDGQKFKFTLIKALGPDEKFGDYSGLFHRKDTIQIKWCNIPQSHYDFWNTLETSRTRQGPFSSYVRIDGNIDRGLGIFGGQNCAYYTLIVPDK